MQIRDFTIFGDVHAVDGALVVAACFHQHLPLGLDGAAAAHGVVVVVDVSRLLPLPLKKTFYEIL
jgi:hypothetical protein